MVGPTPRLPTRPSLEQLRKQAKELLRLYRAGDPTAVARLRAVRPPRCVAGREPGRCAVRPRARARVRELAEARAARRRAAAGRPALRAARAEHHAAVLPDRLA